MTPDGTGNSDQGTGNSNQGKENGHEYVDLGLPSNIKWATCNVGADCPEDYGDYFAWGETEPKDVYSWNTYKWYDTSSEYFSKYCFSSSDGNVDNRKALLTEDDAAHFYWGGTWRMPTKEEQDELRTRCTWNWTSLNDVNGFKIIGPNGNYIFLPAAGYINEGNLYDANTTGRYWSNSLSMINDLAAYYLIFLSKGGNWAWWNRCDGLSVRAVCQ